jgi:hypothetical protein
MFVSHMMATSKEQEQKFADARKKLITLASWDLLDEKHRPLSAIKDTLVYLLKICVNVRDAPDEERYRRVRISNAVFGRHVRDVAGGQEYLLAAGWRPAVVEHDKSLIFEAQPGSLGWRVLEAGVTELQKAEAVVEGKLARKKADKHAEAEQRLEAVRNALQDDKEERHQRFKYKEQSQTGSQGGGGGT